MNISDDYLYPLIGLGILFLLWMCPNNSNNEVYQNSMIDKSKPIYSAEGRIYEGGEVLGEVQNIDGEWKGLLYDSEGNEYWIMEMEHQSGNTWYAYGLEGDMFIITIY